MASISSAWILGRRPWRRPASRIVRVSPAENTPVSQNTSQNFASPLPRRRGDHLLADQADVARPVIPVFLRHRVGPQEGGDQVHRVAPVQGTDGPELLQLRFRVPGRSRSWPRRWWCPGAASRPGPGGPWPPAPPGRRSGGGPGRWTGCRRLGQDLQIGRPPELQTQLVLPPAAEIRWVWASTRPGVTSRPPASSRARAGGLGRLPPVPTAVITPSSIRTQASRSARTLALGRAASGRAPPPPSPASQCSPPTDRSSKTPFRSTFFFLKEKESKRTFYRENSVSLGNLLPVDPL